MSLTSDIKNELAEKTIAKQSEAKAQTASILRFAGGIHLINRNIVVEAEVDNVKVMKNLVVSLENLFDAHPDVVRVGAGGIRADDRYVVRTVENAGSLARLTGLIDTAGRPIRGLSPRLVSGDMGVAKATWRGAFMARGSLSQPGRSGSLEITCPGPEAALALVGAARRLGVSAKSRQVRGQDRVVVRDGEQISRLLTAMGAFRAQEIWEKNRETNQVRGSVNRLANFDDANLRRSARAAVAAGARVRRAFEILGDDIPAHLLQAGQLRLQYKEASLEELGQKADPPLTKDAVAGRIRRLLAMADKAAHDRGVPSTQEAVEAEGLQ
ncbi:DNA-binding protein WhiA [Varibaculum vaginae]|uniref:DNA-binding protein WhiA n=1 Tax=Varibaculum vaginae TaxID=2364797 RepID=UPI000F07A8CA|nr:DNA-binding protein WhiA [Varibaculum vaginae]